MPEIITHGQTGLLVPPAEAEPLASALVQLLSDSPLSEAWGRKCALRGYLAASLERRRRPDLAGADSGEQRSSSRCRG